LNATGALEDEESRAGGEAGDSYVRGLPNQNLEKARSRESRAQGRGDQGGVPSGRALSLRKKKSHLMGETDIDITKRMTSLRGIRRAAGEEDLKKEVED